MLSITMQKTFGMRYADMLIRDSRAQVRDIPGFQRAMDRKNATSMEFLEAVRDVRGQARQFLAESGYPEERLNIVFQNNR